MCVRICVDKHVWTRMYHGAHVKVKVHYRIQCFLPGNSTQVGKPGSKSPTEPPHQPLPCFLGQGLSLTEPGAHRLASLDVHKPEGAPGVGLQLCCYAWLLM